MSALNVFGRSAELAETLRTEAHDAQYAEIMEAKQSASTVYTAYGVDSDGNEVVQDWIEETEPVTRELVRRNWEGYGLTLQRLSLRQGKTITYQEFAADNWTEGTARMQYVWDVLYNASPEPDEIDDEHAFFLSHAFNH